MEMSFEKNNENDLNVLFTKGKITGILSEGDCPKKKVIELLIKTSILKNNNENDLKKEIYYMSSDGDNMLFNITIKDDIEYYLGNYSEEKLHEFMKYFNLDSKILNKNYLELSFSEIKKILIIIGLMFEDKIIILDHPTIKLDIKSIQSLTKILRKIRRENKEIIIISYNTNFLLETVDNIVLFENNRAINFENKFEILCDEKTMNKLNLKIPNVLNFIKKVKVIKNIKLNYRENISELIKDIYRYAK